MKVFDISNTKYKHRLLISYFFIVAVPLIIMTGVIYNISSTNLRKEIEASNQYKLNQFRINMELKLKEMENLASRINIDSKLSPDYMNGNEYNRIEGLNQIAIYMAQNAFISDCYLYMKNTGNVYSSAGQSSLSTLSRNAYKLNSQNEISLINEINNLKDPCFFGDEWFERNNALPVNFVTYMIPISYGNYEPYGVVIFHISKSKIYEMINDITGYVKGSTVIFDSNNYVLLSQNKSFELIPADIRDKLKDNGIKHIELFTKMYGKTKIAMIIDSSEAARLKYVLAIPSAQFIEQLVSIKMLMVEAFLIILAFGILLSIAFSTNIYKPISKLLDTISRQWEESTENNQDFNQKRQDIRINEFDKIGQTVEIAFEQNRNLKAQINMQQPFIREQILTKLLKGEIISTELINNIFNLSHDSAGDSYSYGVLIIDKLIKSEERLIRVFKDNVLNISEEQFGLNNAVYPVELIQNTAIALILSLNITESEYERYYEFVLNMKQTLENVTKEQVVIGGGKLYNSVYKLNRAFVEASAALEKNTLRGNQGVLLFEEIVNAKEGPIWYPVDEQLKFLHSLKQGDKVVALESLENIFSSIKKTQSSILSLKYIYFDIVNMIIKSINEMNITKMDSYIENLMKFTNVEELKQGSNLIVQKLCDTIKENKSVKNTELNNKIMEYINSNYDNINLNLEIVADKFGFSISYLSRFFKEHTNSTFTDYVINLRLQKAKELLTTTELQLKEIVYSVGYTDLTYFMKRFKKTEGITPGQYRELYRKANA